MHHFKTVEEKALEWGVSPQHIQALCRKGKIRGAVKRAGVWFIPDDTPNPTQNTKSGVQYDEFIGTKKRVFESAIKLFVSNGFEGVSLKDIADDVGIRQSAIYNHFKTKQEMLDTIYDYYRHYFILNRSTLEDIEPVLRSGTILDIIKCVRYSFSEENEPKLFDITKIIFQRNSMDERAQEIFVSLIMDDGITYVQTVFNRAIEIGRLAPFDTHAIAIFINSISLYTLYNWIVNPSPEKMKKVLEDEQTQYKCATKFLTDLGRK